MNRMKNTYLYICTKVDILKRLKNKVIKITFLVSLLFHNFRKYFSRIHQNPNTKTENYLILRVITEWLQRF